MEASFIGPLTTYWWLHHWRKRFHFLHHLLIAGESSEKNGASWQSSSTHAIWSYIFKTVLEILIISQLLLSFYCFLVSLNWKLKTDFQRSPYILEFVGMSFMAHSFVYFVNSVNNSWKLEEVYILLWLRFFLNTN